ncbi:MAG: NADPH-dependent glutamate synthase [Deltaproteobacteria bacterium]|nr:NADPH-dependent glutamate synthase [Deltaproteobacteria bacterium]
MAEKKEKIPRQPMSEQDPAARRQNFDEVPFGYDEKTAMIEAGRCLQCKKPVCIDGCPVEIDIPGFIERIREGDFKGSIQVLKQKTALPAVCGRVCPQEDQCEKLCILGRKDDPVAIGRLERFAADWDRAQGEVTLPDIPAKTGQKVAVIGSGPAGLTVAGDLILKGHDVTVFEAFHAGGGVLVYGIPEFRLPKAIVAAEVDYLAQLGVEFRLNTIVGKTLSVDQIMDEEGCDAVFIGVGAGLPRFLGVPGENLTGIYSANEYLTRSNLMKAYRFPEYDTPIVRGKNVAVFGAGNVAMDSARTALRMGAEKVRIVYRRSRVEMPARAEEIHHGEEEGIEFYLLTVPVAFHGDENGRVRGMVCLQCELGEPDESGRCRPEAIEDSEFTLEADLVIIAVGAGPNPILTESTPGLELNKRGYVEADLTTGKTNKPKVWAGGDIVTGSATVILAMGAGRQAANSIHDYLTWGW